MTKTSKRNVPELPASVKDEERFDRKQPNLQDDEDGDEPEEVEVEAEVEVEDEHRANSVVKATYKRRYAERAEAMTRKPKGVPLKALKRMAGDWLAIEVAKLTLDDKAKLVVPSLEALLDANGVKHAHWNRTTKGWQGRLRMTGGLALRTVVAREGELVLPDGATLAAPKAWVAKYER